MNRWLRRCVLMLCAAGVVVTATAQFDGRRRARPRPDSTDRGAVPAWQVNDRFPRDVFTFARLQYTSCEPERTSFAWWTDYRDADLNLSYRLEELTSLKVNPEPEVVGITDPHLFDFPWVFMSGVGNIILDDREAGILRTYLLSGGFLFVDDFWGQAEWDGFHRALKQVFPEREPEDLPRSHPLFHWVYDLPNDRSLQTPSLPAAIRSRSTGVTWEDFHAGGNTREVHFRAVFDDRRRMMVMICHNTDNGDGWEEEGTDPWFFRTFSENKNYPLAINALFYAMTH